MSPFKKPEKPEPDERDERGESEGEKPAQGRESKRREGERKLQAALGRVEDEPGAKRKSKKAGHKRAEGSRPRVERAADRPKKGPREATSKRRTADDSDGKKRSKEGSQRRRSRKRLPLKKRAGSALAVARKAAVAGLLAVVTVLAAGAAGLFAILGRLLAVVLRVWLGIRPPARAAGNSIRRITFAASKQVTPKRMLALVVAGSAVLLVLSQFVDYRSVSIGTDAYSGLEAIAPPPEVDRAEAGDPHSYLFVPIGTLCLGLLFLTLRGRPAAGRLIAIAGAAVIVVALLVDRPAGLDVSGATMSFEGVEAKLLGGFYAQIAAGLALTVSSLLLTKAVVAEAPAKSKSRKTKKVKAADEPRRPVRGAEA